MDKRKDDQYYVEKIVADLNFVVKHTESLTEERFYQHELLQDSIMFRMIQISENIIKLSEGFIKRNQQIPWISIIGLRNRIVHEYGKVDIKIIYDTVKIDIPALIDL